MLTRLLAGGVLTLLARLSRERVRRRFVSGADTAEAEPAHLVAQREFQARPENRIVVSATRDLPHPLSAVLTRRRLLGEVFTPQTRLNPEVTRLTATDPLPKGPLRVRGPALRQPSNGLERHLA